MKNLYQSTCLAALLIIAGHANAENEEAAKKLLTPVTVSDGISEKEATDIATAYFLFNVGCGAFTGITDSDGKWIVNGGFGYGADPIVGFSIDKRSGVITSPIGPSYASPVQLLNEVVAHTGQ